MNWTRKGLQDWIKATNLLPRDVDDGLLTDELIHEAIDESLKQVSFDANLLPVRREFGLVANQWEYPIDVDIHRLRRVWYVASTGDRQRLVYFSPEQFLDERDPTDDTVTEPLYFCYPVMQNAVFQFWAGAPPVYDYINYSYVTQDTVRTIIDSGANFGKTKSGERVAPGDVGHNVDDDSYGYISNLDCSSNRTDGTATSGTNNFTLEDTGKDFTALGVQTGDVIFTPSTGVVTSYGFVTAVGTTTLTYADVKGAAKRFKSSDTYKVGIADRVRLKGATPHPGLREGTTNDFSVGDVTATITGTTFTNTRCTGSSPSGASAGETAIASGGSHGQIGTVGADYIDVDKWIGGVPGAGETVTCRECDRYQIEGRHLNERVMWIGPTPSATASLGTENIEVLGNLRPPLPEEDDDPIAIPEEYKEAVLDCLVWQAARLKGEREPEELESLRMIYRNTAKDFQGDIFRPPIGEYISPWGNRRKSNRRGYRYRTPSGLRWDL